MGDTYHFYADKIHISFTPKTNEEPKEKEKPVEKKKIEKKNIIGKSKLIAILLAFFLGRYGVHKFYLRKPGLGLVYLLFSRFEIMVFVSLCDAMYYIFVNDETWLNEYGYKKMKKKKK